MVESSWSSRIPVMLYWSSVLFVCILTWYHRAVAECESTASLPEAFLWLHPENMIQYLDQMWIAAIPV